MMPRSASRKPVRPLDQRRLEELGLAYVGRFATTRAKLAIYLSRKLRERGWEGAQEPQTAPLIERLASLGYIDDAAFAMSRARALGQRGFGPRRVTMALHQAGIGEDDGREARLESERQAVSAALRFARRRRIGPFALASPDMRAFDPRGRDKALSAMLRAGHDHALSRRILELAPERDIDLEMLVTRLSNFDR